MFVWLLLLLQALLLTLVFVMVLAMLLLFNCSATIVDAEVIAGIVCDCLA